MNFTSRALTASRPRAVIAAGLAAGLSPIALAQVDLISQRRQMENSLVGAAAAPDFAPFERYLSGEDPWFGQIASVHQLSTVESAPPYSPRSASLSPSSIHHQAACSPLLFLPRPTARGA